MGYFIHAHHMHTDQKTEGLKCKREPGNDHGRYVFVINSGQLWNIFHLKHSTLFDGIGRGQWVMMI